MPRDDELNDLRITGWFQEPRRETPSTALIPYRPKLPAFPDESPDRARRVLLACGSAVVAGVAGILAAIVTTDGENGPEPIANQLVFPSFEPLTPVSLLPAPARSSAPPPVVVAIPPNTTPVAGHTTRRPTATPSSAAGRTTAATARLVAGARVGLGLAADSGMRLRHQNFVARASRIGSSSSGLDKADSTFVVRAALAGGDGCVSLESVNYPGYFLRHRDYVLRLEQRGGNRWESSNLFAQDATFCQVTTGGGTALFLESVNYPSRSLHLRDDGLFHLDTGTGTAFTVLSPLA